MSYIQLEEETFMAISICFFLSLLLTKWRHFYLMSFLFLFYSDTHKKSLKNHSIKLIERSRYVSRSLTGAKKYSDHLK